MGRKRMKVYFARHGETKFNLKKILMGQRYDVDLNRTGIAQAEALALIVPREVNIIFCSTLKRAFHTAMIVSDKLRVAVKSSDELEERDLGNLSGKSWAEVEKLTGVSFPYIEEHFDIDLSKLKLEDIGVVKLRLMHFIAGLKRNYSDKVPLVVTHSGIIRVMYSLYPNTPKQDVKNASLHIFEI
ncbi:MAG: hypothetical protein JWO40_481 [Candidatus Doudnabacteria bacterium]|nr:hypothetical protein [Candidatus Doudnabacteria bacterium]